MSGVKRGHAQRFMEPGCDKANLSHRCLVHRISAQPRRGCTNDRYKQPCDTFVL